MNDSYIEIEYDLDRKCYVLYSVDDTSITLDAETYESAVEEATFIVDNYYLHPWNI